MHSDAYWLVEKYKMLSINFKVFVIQYCFTSRNNKNLRWSDAFHTNPPSNHITYSLAHPIYKKCHSPNLSSFLSLSPEISLQAIIVCDGQTTSPIRLMDRCKFGFLVEECVIRRRRSFVLSFSRCKHLSVAAGRCSSPVVYTLFAVSSACSSLIRVESCSGLAGPARFECWVFPKNTCVWSRSVVACLKFQIGSRFQSVCDQWREDWGRSTIPTRRNEWMIWIFKLNVCIFPSLQRLIKESENNRRRASSSSSHRYHPRHRWNRTRKWKQHQQFEKNSNHESTPSVQLYAVCILLFM